MVRESMTGRCLRATYGQTIILREGAMPTNPPVPVRNEGRDRQMCNIWDVVEELAAVAYERHTTTIPVTQIRKHLKAAEQDSPQNVEEICKTLIQLDYRVVVGTASRSGRSSLKRKDL